MVFKKDVPRSHLVTWVRAWQDVLLGAMVLASLFGLIYAFTRE
jgi:hypothetical protein